MILYEKDGDDRIFRGYVLETLDDVTLTGYWEGKFSNSSSYYITLATELIPNVKRFRRNKDGSTSLVTFHKNIDNVIGGSKNDSNFFISDSEQSGLNSTGEYPEFKPLPISGWELDLFVYYDDSFYTTLNKDKFEAKRFIKRVIQQTEPLFSHVFSFPTKIKLNLLGIEYSPGNTWRAEDRYVYGISTVTRYFVKGSRVYVFFCLPPKHDGIYGIVQRGKLGYLCDGDETTRMTIVECDLDSENKEMSAAVILAHEIGHIFGIYHDKNYRKWDKQSRNCTGKGGIMDNIIESLLNNINDYKWTECSHLDLLKFYNSIIVKEPFCLKKLPADERDMYVEKGKQVLLPCIHRCPKDLLVGIKWIKSTSRERFEILTHRLLKGFKKIIYNKKHLDELDQENILIDSKVSNIDLVIKNTKAFDKGNYICEPVCRDPTYGETGIVSLHVEGKNLISKGVEIDRIP